MKKVLFLDRDGIVNIDTVDVHRKEDFIFTKDIFKLCRYARERGFELIIMTNQTGVSRDVFTEDDIKELHTWVKQQFKNHNIDILDIYYCIEYESFRRKPRPGMFYEAIQDHEIDIYKSLMIGDKVSDRIEMEGLKSFIVKSKYTKDGYDIESLLDLKVYL